MSGAVVPAGGGESLADFALVVREALDTESAESAAAVRAGLERRGGLLSRWFPAADVKALQQVNADRIHANAGSQARLFTLYSNLQVEVARQRSDALIVRAGIEIQGELTDYSLAALGQLEESIGRRRQAFLQSYVRQLEEAEEYAHLPDLAADLKASLDKQRTVYFDTCAALLDGFSEALSKRLPREQGR